MVMKRFKRMLLPAIIALALAAPARAQDDEAAELAKKLANPVANLISVPVQYNYDEYGGANDGGAVSTLNIQPVIPFPLNEDWNLITRTIVPLIDRQDFPLEAMNESGLGDIDCPGGAIIQDRATDHATCSGSEVLGGFAG
jgi:hypothetical protein